MNTPSVCVCVCVVCSVRFVQVCLDVDESALVCVCDAALQRPLQTEDGALHPLGHSGAASLVTALSALMLQVHTHTHTLNWIGKRCFTWNNHATLSVWCVSDSKSVTDVWCMSRSRICRSARLWTVWRLWWGFCAAGVLNQVHTHTPLHMCVFQSGTDVCHVVFFNTT